MITEQKEIGARLRQIRKRNKLSQADLAAASGLSVKNYADIERGTVNMRVGTMLRICQALCITPNDIFIDHNRFDSDREKAAALLRLALDLTK